LLLLYLNPSSNHCFSQTNTIPSNPEAFLLLHHKIRPIWGMRVCLRYPGEPPPCPGETPPCPAQPPPQITFLAAVTWQTTEAAEGSTEAPIELKYPPTSRKKTQQVGYHMCASKVSPKTNLRRQPRPFQLSITAPHVNGERVDHRSREFAHPVKVTFCVRTICGNDAHAGAWSAQTRHQGRFLKSTWNLIWPQRSVALRRVCVRNFAAERRRI